MRVIAGTARSLPLKTVEGLDTRPTTDRIKETLFNILMPDIPGAEFLDLFAGSGGIGIEALSRGASHAVFVENSQKAVNCINENIRFTKFTSSADVIRTDALSYIRNLRENNFDIIFMDPPYGKKLEQDIIFELDRKNFAKDGIVVIEAALHEDFHYIEEKTGFRIYKIKEYKTNKHIFICKN